MALTRIEWADLTFNPWWGCDRVSPACAHCYADDWARRFGRELWGAGHVFRFFGDKHWAEPLKWARSLPGKLGRRPRVFCASMADVFEERPELEDLRWRLFELIEATPELDWLILTKRPEFAKVWLQLGRQATPDEVDNGFELGWVPPFYYDRPAPLANVWVGVSIENARFTWRADVLRGIPAAVRFISAEPLLGSLFKAPSACGRDGDRAARRLARPASDAEGLTLTEASAPRGVAPLDLRGIDWVIVGGESGPKARPFHVEHAVEILDEAVAGVPAVFVKQLGSVPHWNGVRFQNKVSVKGGAWEDLPSYLQVREFPRSAAA